MDTKIDFFETLEITNTDANTFQYNLPVIAGNVENMRIRSIIAYSSSEVPKSPSQKNLIDVSFFGSAFLKILTRGKTQKIQNIPLRLLNPSLNNGKMFDFQGLEISQKDCQIIMGSNDLTQVGKVFFLAFLLEPIK